VTRDALRASQKMVLTKRRSLTNLQLLFLALRRFAKRSPMVDETSWPANKTRERETDLHG